MNDGCYCLNRYCPYPENPFTAEVCRSCGSPLELAGRYRAIALIGESAVSRTWQGLDHQPKENHPKGRGQHSCVIQQGWFSPEGEVQPQLSRPQFSAYAQRLEQFSQHPQVPQLLEAILRGDSWHLVWAWIDGVSLAARLAEGRPFDEAEARQLLSELLPVLSRAQDHGIVHQDIKPENIICGASQRLWLVDFGAALVEGSMAAKPAGNAQYAAPEQVAGQPGFASDLYSLGLLCAELLTLVSPFDLYSAAQTDQLRQTYLAPLVSPELGQVLAQLLRPAPQRYRTAAAVLRDLEALPALTPQLPPSPPPQDSAQDTWRCHHRATDHRGAVTAIAAGPTTVVSGGSDRSIRVWTWEGECRQVIQPGRKGHRDRISALQISDDELTLFSSSDDGTLCVWSLADCRRQTRLVSQSWDVSAIAATPSLLISGGANGALQLWDWQNGVAIERWRQHRGKISGLAISPNQQILVSSSHDGTIRFWDLDSAKPLNVLQVGAAVTAMAVLPRWDVLALGDERGQLQLWDIVDMSRLYVTAAHQGAVTALSPSPQRLASGGDDAQIHLWGLPGSASEPKEPFESSLLTQPQNIARLHALPHDWCVSAIALNPTGDQLVSGSADETLRFWRRCKIA